MEQVLDMAVVDELLSLTEDGNPELLLDLIQMFLDDGPRKVELVVQGLQAQDFEQMERAAHSLKGSSGHLGAHLLQEVCEQIQVTSSKRDPALAKSLTEQLAARFAEAQQALRSLRQRYGG